MSLSSSAVDFTATFDLTASTKEIIITDTTDYTAESVTAASGAITVTTPTGSTIADTIADPITTTTNGGTIAIPLDSSGNFVTGEYTIAYTVTESAPGSDVQTRTRTFDFDYSSPTVDLTVTIDCIKPELKSVDDTSYTQLSTTPTITRAHTIFYPAQLEVTNATGTSQTLTTSTFYTTQHSAKCVSTLTYNVSANFIILDEVSGTETFDVTCDDSLCDLYCCIKAERARYESYKNTNQTMYEKHLNNFIHIVALGWELSQAISCGKTGDVSSLSNEILELANCEAGCGCNGDDPVQVVGISGSNAGTIEVQTGGTPIVVTSATDGDTTTYSISIDSTFVTKVNNSYNTTVVAGDGVTVNTTTAVNGDKEYEVVANNASTSNILSFKLLVDFTTATSSIPTLTISQITRYGSAFANSGIAIVNRKTNNSDWLANTVGFSITGIWDTQGSLVYKSHIDTYFQEAVIDSFNTGSLATITSQDPFDTTSVVRAEIVDHQDAINTTGLKFRLIDLETSQPIDGNKCVSNLSRAAFFITLIA
jgi:hypothetical protein